MRDVAKRKSKFCKKKGRKGRRNRLKGARGRGTLEKKKPPILGLIERGGDVVITMLENVKQTTIEPIIRSFIKEGSTVYTDVLVQRELEFSIAPLSYF